MSLLDEEPVYDIEDLGPAVAPCCWEGSVCLIMHTDPGSGLKYVHFKHDVQTAEINIDEWEVEYQ